jgi:glycosyltransferase involved in cell wall biosynthesis
VYYASRLTTTALECCIRESGADVIWLNSLFSRASLRVLISRQLGRIHQPVLLAPRGELSPGALALKRWRKRAGIRFLLSTRSLNAVDWLASSDHEAEDIFRVVGNVAISRIPESVSAPPSGRAAWPFKQSGRLRAVYAARIAPMKNLLFLLEALVRCRQPVHLDLIGPIDDPAYWAKCRHLMARLPAHLSVTYSEEVAHDELLRRLPTYDVMLLPTLGENFGHAIVEAWSAGCPVLVSDRTPWRQLEVQGGGWDRPLDRELWTDMLQRCVAMSDADLRPLRQRAVERARRVWQEGLDGDQALRRLILNAAQRRVSSRPGHDRQRQDGLATDAKGCR